MICSGCGLQFQTGETQYHSSVFGCDDDDWLCASCSALEEEEINKKGNDLPVLRRMYRNIRIRGGSETVER